MQVTTKNKGTNKEYDVKWDHTTSAIDVQVVFPPQNTMSDNERREIRDREIRLAQTAFNVLRGITR